MPIIRILVKIMNFMDGEIEDMENKDLITGFQ